MPLPLLGFRSGISLVNAASESKISGLPMFPQMACKVAWFSMVASQLSLVGILWGILVFCFSSVYPAGPFSYPSFVRAILCCSLEDYCVLVGYSVGDKVLLHSSRMSYHSDASLFRLRCRFFGFQLSQWLQTAKSFDAVLFEFTAT